MKLVKPREENREKSLKVERLHRVGRLHVTVRFLFGREDNLRVMILLSCRTLASFVSNLQNVILEFLFSKMPRR